MGAWFVIPVYAIALVLALKWTCRPSMAFKAFLLQMLAIAVAPLIANVLAALLIGALVYDGQCYGFTDGQWACDLNEFLGIQLQYAVLFTTFINIIWIGAVLLMVAGNVGYRFLKRV